MVEFIKFMFGQDQGREGLELTMTSEHLLFVAGKNGKKVVKRAGQVYVGKKN